MISSTFYAKGCHIFVVIVITKAFKTSCVFILFFLGGGGITLSIYLSVHASV